MILNSVLIEFYYLECHFDFLLSFAVTATLLRCMIIC